MKRFLNLFFKPVLVLSLVLILSGSSFAEDLKIYTDESFKYALPDLIKTYNKSYPKDKISYFIAPSPVLYEKIQKSSNECDLIFTSDLLLMNILSDNKKFEVASRFNFGSCDLVMITSKTNKFLKSFNDVKTNQVKKIALVSDSAMERFAMYSFKQSKLLERLERENKFIKVKTLTEAISKVKSGSVDCAFVFKPHVTKDVKVIKTTSSKESGQSSLCTGGIIKGSKHYSPASNFSYFLNTDPAKNVLLKHGFKTGTTQY
ncbi:MAG: substrate-binding domain-containing protein [Synergistaceae bacterium]